MSTAVAGPSDSGDTLEEGWLSRRVVIQTNIGVDEARRRLSSLIDPPSWNPFHVYWPARFVGRVNPTGFRAVHKVFLRSQVGPRISGKLLPASDGCRVDVTFTMIHPIEGILWAVLALYVPWIALYGQFPWYFFVIAPLSVFMLYIFRYDTFRRTSRFAESKLYEVLARDSA